MVGRARIMKFGAAACICIITTSLYAEDLSAYPQIACQNKAFSVYEEVDENTPENVTSQSVSLQIYVKHNNNPTEKLVVFTAKGMSNASISCSDERVDVTIEGMGSDITAKREDGRGVMVAYHLAPCLQKPSCIIQNQLKRLDLYTNQLLNNKGPGLEPDIINLQNTLLYYNRFLEINKNIISK